MNNFKGKSVALVGNASSLFDRKYGSEIDSHDVVCRMNRAAMLYTKFFEFLSHGNRTDVWFVWRLKEYEFAKQVKRPDKIIQISPAENTEETFIQFPEEKFNEYVEELKAVPSTGFCSLMYLLQSGALSVTLYGFDWKKTPTFTDLSRDIDSLALDSIHNFSLEKEIINSLKNVVIRS